MINEWRIGKGLEGNDHGIVEILDWTCVKGLRKPRKAQPE
jgi:hypothetical protein